MRTKHSFFELVQNPQLACEVTLMVRLGHKEKLSHLQSMNLSLISKHEQQSLFGDSTWTLLSSLVTSW